MLSGEIFLEYQLPIVDNVYKHEHVQINSENKVYQLLFIQDKNQNVEAYETNCIKCVYEELANQLRIGNSVFINQKRN